MQKKDKQINKLNKEIENLKKTLKLKVEKHKHFSHPEVIMTSKMLDQKVLELMMIINNIDENREMKI